MEDHVCFKILSSMQLRLASQYWYLSSHGGSPFQQHPFPYLRHHLAWSVHSLDIWWLLSWRCVLTIGQAIWVCCMGRLLYRASGSLPTQLLNLLLGCFSPSHPKQWWWNWGHLMVGEPCPSGLSWSLELALLRIFMEEAQELVPKVPLGQGWEIDSSFLQPLLLLYVDPPPTPAIG